MFAQAIAATAAPSRTAALPISVARKSRSGPCRLRAQAVRPLNLVRASESEPLTSELRGNQRDNRGEPGENRAAQRDHALEHRALHRVEAGSRRESSVSRIAYRPSKPRSTL